MKNIIKIVLVMLTAFSFSLAQAGELTVTGSAKASYIVHSSDSSSGAAEGAAGLGVANEFNLGASGELDNGLTWKYNINIDGATVQDDGGLSLSSSNLGTFAINVSQGGLEYSKAAAITANGDRASDTGFAEGMQEEHSIGDMRNIQYHTPAGLLPFGIALKVAYAPDTSSADNSSVNAAGGTGGGGNGSFTSMNARGTAINISTATTQGSNIGRSMTAYQVTAAPIEGLTVGASYQDYDGVTAAAGVAQMPESGSWFAKYSMGPATFAYGKAYIAPAIATSAAGANVPEYFDNTKYSLSINANENFSVAYSVETSDANYVTGSTANIELESSSISAAYTVGGMTIAVAQASHENIGYVLNRDVKTTLVNLSMAF